MKKLFAVTLEREIVVAAEDAEDALRVARDALSDPYFEESPEPSSARELMRGQALPGDYASDCIPWGADDDQDIAGYLADAPIDPMYEKLADKEKP